jgi:hypothetical protein
MERVARDALREELRRRNYLPLLFDFDPPKSRDLTETVSLLAGMARFVVADLTEPRSVPRELGVIVPELRSVPLQPLIQRGHRVYSMFERWHATRRSCRSTATARLMTCSRPWLTGSTRSSSRCGSYARTPADQRRADRACDPADGHSPCHGRVGSDDTRNRCVPSLLTHGPNAAGAGAAEAAAKDRV